MSRSFAAPEGSIFSIGHSTLPIERFIALLRAYGIERLADVRALPRSRHNPQFNDTTLMATLPSGGIDYVPARTLGGLRHAQQDSINTGWRNKGFRGYADYMQTPEFLRGLELLLQMSTKQRVAIMCAEAMPWQCHRSLIADALCLRSIPVVEILSESDFRMHELTSFARFDGLQLTYPPAQGTLL